MDTKQKSYIDLSTFYNGRLKVYKKKYANRNNTVSKVYFGRTNVNGKVKELSSGESNKRKAILLLKEKYNDLLLQIMASEIKILLSTEWQGIFHSTSKKDLARNCTWGTMIIKLLWWVRTSIFNTWCPRPIAMFMIVVTDF